MLTNNHHPLHLRYLVKRYNICCIDIYSAYILYLVYSAGNPEEEDHSPGVIISIDAVILAFCLFTCSCVSKRARASIDNIQKIRIGTFFLTSHLPYCKNNESTKDSINKNKVHIHGKSHDFKKLVGGTY
mmetsp:Transcript_6195/g.11713  ORF Transcript_6195/g.11713 Transcript_6195/m.11713 type:complete len:129 (+) Transcript_6195:96-482(+)